MDQWLKDNLVCPRDHGRLEISDNTLVCRNGHIYPYLDGIPVMLLEEVRPTHEVCCQTIDQAASGGASEGADKTGDGGGIDPYVQRFVGATCGIMYKDLINSLTSYPIPELRLQQARGEYLLDIGCNWGRWTISAARKGFKSVGIDPSLEAIRAARRVARQLKVSPQYLVGDSRYLPFADNAFHVAFSYSVFQHFIKSDVKVSLAEVARVLKPSGTCLAQLPNRFGLRSLYHQLRLMFQKEEQLFGIHYWSPSELKGAFGDIIGPTSLSVDGFFSLNAQKTDAYLLPRRYRMVVSLSEALRKFSEKAVWMIYFADSLYVTSTSGKPAGEKV